MKYRVIVDVEVDPDRAKLGVDGTALRAHDLAVDGMRYVDGVRILESSVLPERESPTEVKGDDHLQAG